jgi:hypothetical protein
VSLDRNDVTTGLRLPLESLPSLIRLCGVHSVQSGIDPVIVSTHISDVNLNLSDRTGYQMVLQQQRVSRSDQLNGRLLGIRVGNEESPILDLVGGLQLSASRSGDTNDPGIVYLRVLVLIEKGRVV